MRSSKEPACFGAINLLNMCIYMHIFNFWRRVLRKPKRYKEILELWRKQLYDEEKVILTVVIASALGDPYG